jgi:hypothetical protein
MMAVLLLFPATVWGQDALDSSANPDPTGHRHRGFYLHFDIGAGYYLSKTDSGSLSGVSIPVAFALGGAVIENLIIAPELWLAVSPSPHVPVEGTVAWAFTVGFGLNITYYFMPSNVYLTMTPSYVHVDSYRGCPGGGEGYCLGANPPSSSLEANTFGMRTALGKEWWVSTHWGVGVSIEFIFTLTGRVVTGASGNALAGGLTLSATYN